MKLILLKLKFIEINLKSKLSYLLVSNVHTLAGI